MVSGSSMVLSFRVSYHAPFEYARNSEEMPLRMRVLAVFFPYETRNLQRRSLEPSLACRQGTML